MVRIGLAVLAMMGVCGCSSFQHQADYPCDDCVPPPVAGKHKYHRTIDNFLTTLTAQHCAHRDLKQIKYECGPMGRDYKDGYTQAYIDLAAGRPACVPAVPPPKYWHAWHRSCAGREGVDEWYAGYRNGLDNGVNGGVNHFNRIVASPEGCCVSAAYVSPYATSAPPNSILPLNNQVISRSDAESPRSENPALATEQQPTASPEAIPAAMNVPSNQPAQQSYQ